MSPEFKQEFLRQTYYTKCEWLVWIGMPMLYDGGLCVNRTSEEHRESDKHRNRIGLMV